MAQFFYPELAEIKADNSETARYLGYRKIDTPQTEVTQLIEKCVEKMFEVLKPSATFEIFDVELMTENENLSYTGDRVKCMTFSENLSYTGDRVNCTKTTSTRIKFADIDFCSQDLGRNLSSCKKIALFAATIGPQVDAMIRKAQIVSPVEAAVLQATGAMYIEKVVDLVNQRIKKEAAALGLKTKPRYSPGYGDVPLTMQKDFFRLLPCTRIGLSLMDTLIMSPEKSVTAFVGLY